MNKRGGVEEMAGFNVAMLILAGLVILSTIGVIIFVIASLLSSGSDKAMIDNFNNLDQVIKDLLEDEEVYASDIVTLTLDTGAVIVGYDKEWDEEVLTDKCPLDFAYKPTGCLGKSCLVLYSDDTFDDKEDKDDNILGQLKKYEADIMFLGEMPPLMKTGLIGTQRVDTVNHGMQRTPPAEFQNLVPDAEYQYLFTYGQCGLTGLKLKTQLFHVEKFKGKEKTYIYIVPKIEGRNTDARAETLKLKFGDLIKQLEKHLTEGDQVKALSLGAQVISDSNQRAKIEAAGQLDDVYYFIAVAFEGILADFENKRGTLISFKGKNILQLSGEPTEDQVTTRMYEYFFKSLEKPSDIQTTRPDALRTILSNEQELEKFLLGESRKQKVMKSLAAEYDDPTFNRFTKRFLAEHMLHFSTVDADKNHLVGPLSDLTSQDYAGDDRKADMYVVINMFMTEIDDSLIVTDILTALSMVERIQKTFSQNPDTQEQTLEMALKTVCWRIRLRESLSSQDKDKIYLKCDELELLLLGGEVHPGALMLIFIQRAEFNREEGEHFGATLNYLKALKLIQKHLMEDEIGRYVYLMDRVLTTISDNELTERELEQVNPQLEEVRPSPSQIPFFPVYQEGKEAFDKQEYAVARNKFEKLLTYIPPEKFEFFIATESQEVIKMLAESYVQTDKKEDCRTNIIDKIPEGTHFDYLDKIKIDCAEI